MAEEKFQREIECNFFSEEKQTNFPSSLCIEGGGYPVVILLILYPPLIFCEKLDPGSSIKPKPYEWEKEKLTI